MRARNLVPAVAAILLAGCAAWTLVDNQRHSVAGRYSVAAQIQWSRIKQGGVELWTVDGVALQAVRFFDPLEDGSALLSRPTESDDKLPVFRSGMTPTEVQELVVHTVERSGGANVRASGLRPWRFGGLAGFRFELEFLNDSGLEMRAIFAGALDGERLLLVAYSGTRAHYYPKYLPVVERLLESIDTAV
jgi:hypothetical protein